METAPECAICLETVAESVDLPCRCKIMYCFQCWDRCLAESFNSQGAASCPTCRTPVKVDFEAESGRLLFSEAPPLPRKPRLEDLGPRPSREADAEAYALWLGRAIALEREYHEAFASAVKADIDRLIDQAIPAQERILQRYGDTSAAFKSVPDCAEEALKKFSVAELQALAASVGSPADDFTDVHDITEHLRTATTCEEALLSCWAQASCAAAPRCVCGGALRYVVGRERICRMLRNFRGIDETHPRFEEIVAKFTTENSTCATCDLCRKNVNIKEGTWTCERGRKTIFHATAYDVCVQCFGHHVGLLPHTEPEANAPAETAALPPDAAPPDAIIV
eukprot:TRINITY_DN3102_c0_g1_i2.p1 TRINITY_DN3102_c0_g1~~TRINITY_DN3102_c0_g1_i2.p1  ORF type:complete len:337 (-),score=29.86 TRINITY_DN3102_c0_g1_i2:201-1211(-)